MAEKLGELADELRSLFSGRAPLLDALTPPLVFVLVNAVFSFATAAWVALALAAGFAVLRLRRRQPALYALGGVAAVLVAILLAVALGRSEGYFLPGIVTDVGTALAALLSIALQRPLVACTSFLARRWPWNWYWHPRVQPGYTEVTWFWTVYFSARAILQWYYFQNQATGVLALLSVILGWPATVTLLAVSYLYGTWRLRRLGGPSVEEFRSGEPAPWISQQRGF